MTDRELLELAARAAGRVSYQWCAGYAECLSCGHEWIAVWPLNGDDLKCPECESIDTIREHDPSYVRNDDTANP